MQITFLADLFQELHVYQYQPTFHHFPAGETLDFKLADKRYPRDDRFFSDQENALPAIFLPPDLI